MKRKTILLKMECFLRKFNKSVVYQHIEVDNVGKRSGNTVLLGLKTIFIWEFLNFFLTKGYFISEN